jgi:ribosomal protein L10
MAVTRAKKVAQVEQLGGELKNASSMIVATYSKLTVTQDFELRKALRPTGAK